MKRVLDTNAILYFLGGKLAQRLPTGEYCISVISEIELLSYPTLDETTQAKIQDFLLEVTIVNLTTEVKTLAIQLRRRLQLKLPDAIIAATAVSLGATLLTNDAKLLRVPGLTSEELKLRNL